MVPLAVVSTGVRQQRQGTCFFLFCREPYIIREGDLGGFSLISSTTVVAFERTYSRMMFFTVRS